MCRRTTIRAVLSNASVLLPWFALGLTSVPVWGQGTGVSWRHVGNSAIQLTALPAAATGPVDRVWYSTDGSTLFAKTTSGRVFKTGDFEQWQLVTDGKATPPAPNEAEVASLNMPEVAFKVSSPAGSDARLYGIGGDVY